MELRSSSLFTCQSSSVRPLIPMSRLGTGKSRNRSNYSKEFLGQEVSRTVTCLQVRPKGARSRTLATEYEKLIVVGRYPSTNKTFMVVELSVRSPSLCLFSSARETSSIPLSWQFLDLESCSIRNSSTSQSSTCASR